jgi:hypothetical protein
MAAAPALGITVPSPLGPERELWQGTPSAKALLGAILAGAIFALAVTTGVYLIYGPALTFAAQLSPEVARFVASNEAGLRLAAIAFVVTVVGLRLFRLAWRVAVLKSYHYRAS